MNLNSQNIWAVGKNYAAHVREMQSSEPSKVTELKPQKPMIFLKAGSSIVLNNTSFLLPQFSNEIHHEVEIALRFGPSLKIDAFTIALDLTARDTQSEMKAKGHPWTLAKSFKNSCPLGYWHFLKHEVEPSAERILADLNFTFHVNGELKQKGHVSEMIFSMQQVCDYVRENFPVVPGDILLTGTPAGVGPILPGDVLEAEITNYVKARWSVGKRNA